MYDISTVMGSHQTPVNSISPQDDRPNRLVGFSHVRDRKESPR